VAAVRDWRIEGRQGLSEGFLAEIRGLARACEQHDGLHLKLNWDMLANRSPRETNDFFCYAGSKLAGYLALYGFGRPELELNGMVHPAFRRRGVFKRLVTEAKAECARRGIPKLIFICDRKSPSGLAFVQHLGARYSFSEYGMELAGEPAVGAHPGAALEYRMAVVDDVPVMAELDAACFGLPLDQAQLSADRIGKPNCRGLLGLHDGRVVGKAFVALEEDSAFVCGLGVRPSDQGRGFGRAILCESTRTIRKETSLPIRLEVACENPRALNLYQSCGFRTTTTYDYYELDLPTGSAAGG
jgi:ribosomal protein S18 acetylase RimI-like enzyme